MHHTRNDIAALMLRIRISFFIIHSTWLVDDCHSYRENVYKAAAENQFRMKQKQISELLRTSATQ